MIRGNYWYPDFPGQQMQQDPDYIRMYGQQGMQVQQPAQQVRQQIHNGGFVITHSEQEARNWPVAPGNCVTFKDESAPYIYTKTASYNQMEPPVFEKFRLTKEEDGQQPQTQNQEQSAPE